MKALRQFTISRSREYRRIYMIVAAFSCIMLATAQTSVQNFGASTGSHTSQTGTTAFIPNPTSGTTWARAGALAPAAPVNLATATNPLGTAGAYVRAVASSTGSVTKFSPMVGYTGSTQFYTSFKVLFGDAAAGSTASNGIWAFYQGGGAMYSDANNFAGAQVFTGIRFAFTNSGTVTLGTRAGGSWTSAGITISALFQATAYTVEIIGNNQASGTINYTYNGNPMSVAINTFDLYINGILIGNDLAKAQLANNTDIVSNTFIGESSAGNTANVFVDDVVVYNTVPAAIGSGPNISVNPNTLTGFTYPEGSGPSLSQSYQISGGGLIPASGNLTVTGSSSFEVSADNSTFGPSALIPYASGSLSNTPVYVRLKAGYTEGYSASEVINNTGGGAPAVTVTCSGDVTTLPAPVATSPTAANSTSFTANWSSVPGASSYRLDVSDSPTFGSSSPLSLTEGFDGGTTPPPGWTFIGINSTYNSLTNYGQNPPSLSLDNSGESVETPSLSGPATSLSFWIKGQGTNATSALLVEGYDGSNWVMVHTITNSLPTTGTVITYNAASTPALPGNLIRFRFTYTKSVGNLALDDISIDYGVLSPSYLPGYQDLIVNGLSQIVTGVTPCSTAYYYRVRAVSPTSTSGNSNVITQHPALQQFRSAGSGPWNATATWEQYNGTAWIPATSYPGQGMNDCASPNVTIRSGHVVVFPATLTYEGDVVVESGSTLDLADGQVLTLTAGSSLLVQGTLSMAPAAVIDGSGSFTLAGGAEMRIGSPNGIAVAGASGHIQVTGTRTFASGANYLYNGTANQLTGTGLSQNIPGNLTINNPGNTVSLTASTFISGNLFIQQGTLDANNQDLTLGGSWTNNGTFVPGTATVTFNGSNPVTFGPEVFHHLNIQGSGIKSATGALLIGGSLSISGHFQAGSFEHTINGDWINNGTFTPGTSNIVFANNAADQIIGGSATSGFYGLEVMKGSIDRVLEVTGPISINATVANSLIITSGTFKLSHPSVIAPFWSGPQATIPVNGCFWNNGGTVLGDNFSWFVYGMFRHTAGVLNIGNSPGNSLRYFTGSSILIEGGIMNIAARISREELFPVGSTTTYVQSGGVVNLVMVASESASVAGFDIGETGSSFTMSGGEIILQRPTSNAVDFLNRAATHLVTGGVVRFGNALTPASQVFRIDATAPVYDLVVNAFNNPVLRLENNALQVNNDVLIAGTLESNNLNIRVGRNWVNNGAFLPGTATVEFFGSANGQVQGGNFHNLLFSGSGTKTAMMAMTVAGNLGITDNFNGGSYLHNLYGNWTNDGTYSPSTASWLLGGVLTQTLGGINPTTFYRLDIDNANGIILNNSIFVQQLLALTDGLVTTGGNTLTMLSTGTINGGSVNSHINGRLAWEYLSTGSRTFTIGKGGIYRPLIFNYSFIDQPSVVTAEQFQSMLAGNLPPYTTLYADRYWEVSQAGAGYFVYDITLDGTGYVPDPAAEPVILKDGSDPLSLLPAIVNGTLYTAFTQSSLSGFGLGSYCPPPVITLDPQDAEVCEGEIAHFTVDATGSGSHLWQYQWQESASGPGGPFVSLTDGGIYLGVSAPQLSIYASSVSLDGYAYRVILTRDCGTSITTTPVLLTVHETPSATYSATQIPCYSAANGTIQINVSGGLAPYSYSIDNGLTYPYTGASPFTVQNLPPGLYQVRVRDFNGCESSVCR